MERGPVEERINQALELERLLFAKAQEEMMRAVTDASTGAQADFSRRGLGGSGMQIGSIIEAHVNMLKQMATKRVEIRKEVVQTVREMGSKSELARLREEEVDRRTGHLRFDINLLSTRVKGVTNWLTLHPVTRNLKIGYFGASTGAAAALVAATEHPLLVGAVVSRGGRPDLASSSLTSVQAPTLLIVGSKDTQVIELNRMAFSLLRGEKQLEIVAGATHLVEEPGALEQVAQLASKWIECYLAAGAS